MCKPTVYLKKLSLSIHKPVFLRAATVMLLVDRSYISLSKLSQAAMSAQENYAL